MNNLKTLMLMVLLAAIMMFIGGLVGGKSGLMFMLILSLGMNVFSYWFSDSMVLRAYGAQEITREDAPQLYGLVEKLAANADLPMPKVCIINSDVPNAFATGRNPDHAACDRPAEGLPRKAGLPHRRHGGPGLHHRAGVQLGGGRHLLGAGRFGHQRLYHVPAHHSV